MKSATEILRSFMREPGSITLLLAGVAGMIAVFRRRGTGSSPPAMPRGLAFNP